MSSWSSQVSHLEGHSRTVRSSSSNHQLAHSPRPGSSPLARPQWPWSSHSHRPTSSSSPISISPAPAASSLTEESSQWSGSSRGGLTLPLPEEISTRQWTFTAFEWTIKNVAALRDHVENTPTIQEPLPATAQTASDDVPDVLKESPMIGENGENKFKVEIARTPIPEERAPTPTLTPPSPRPMHSTLSLYITSLFLDFAHPEYEFCAAIMVAIKCREDRAGERGARSDWVWEFWDQEFSFRKESEFWECQLPPLSTLLANPRIQNTDSFVLCIQIHSPIGPIYPQFPSAYYVPKDLLEGLESSLDNAYTGDVRFITVERMPTVETPDPATPTSRRSSDSSGNRSKPPTMARKRVLYAHSDVLKRRSEYFSTMLTSSFLESSSITAYSSDPSIPPRKIHDIIVSEADFVTVYWLLKWIYADWLLFREDDDPRDAVEGMGGGWSIKCLAPATNAPGHGEWDWRRMKRSTFPVAEYGSGEPGSEREWDEEDFTRAVAVRSPSVGSSGDANPGVQPMVAEEVLDGRPTLPVPSPGVSGRRSASTASSSRGRVSGGAVSTRGGVALSPNSNRRTATSAPMKSAAATSTNYPVGSSTTSAAANTRTPHSPHQSTHPRNQVPQVTPDPHPHPSLECPPASALSIYQIAHRYGISGLQSLALEHMMNTITPKTAFPLLLATYVWDELHTLVEDYIVEHFDAVSRCNVFEACCQEIASGEWGPEGGRTLAGLFRRLTSPAALRYARA
ncbi:hypothetical protein FRC02_007092 [Tulasnella sp. 418]|nr:hypothetical protein FRC02_007092 [Tulasnella sp. 418]